MKKIALFMSLFVLPLAVFAQNSPIDGLFDKYYGKEGFTTVLVTQDMFEVVAKMEKSEGEIEGELGDELGNIKRVRVIAQEDEGEPLEGVNFMKELKGADFDDYKELVVVKESDQEVLILAKEENEKLAELLIVVGGEDNVLVSIEGKFTMDDLASLSHMEGLEGLEGLEDILP